MQPRRLPEGQTWLIERIQKLGLKSNKNGTCFGVACNGAVGIVGDQIDAHDRGYLAAHDVPTYQFKQRIDKNRMANKKKDKDLDCADKLIHKIELCQNADDYVEIYPDSARSEIKQCRNIFANALSEITSKRMARCGGVVSFGTVLIEIFTAARLKIVLDTLLIKIRDHKLKTPLAFLISTTEHAYTFGYNPSKKIWFFIDANNLPSLQYDKIDTHLLAEQIVESSLHSRKCLLRLEAACQGNSRQLVEKLLHDWNKTIEIDKNELIIDFNYQNKRGLSLIDVTAAYGTLAKTQDYLNLPGAKIVTEDGFNLVIINRRFDTLDTLLDHLSSVPDFLLPRIIELKESKLPDVDKQRLVVKMLKLGANINAIYNDKTSLMFAIKQKNLKLIQLLLEHGAHSWEFTPSLKNAFTKAVSVTNWEIFRTLISFRHQQYGSLHPYVPGHPKGYVILLAAIKNYTPENLDSKKILEYCLKEININASIPGFSFTPLYYAAKRNPFAVKVIINCGADVNLRVKKNSATPLYVAIKNSQVRSAAYLLAAGADPNLISGLKCITPLELALKSPDTVGLLLKYGANPNAILNSKKCASLISIANRQARDKFLLTLLHDFYKNISSETDYTTKRFNVLRYVFRRVNAIISENSPDFSEEKIISSSDSSSYSDDSSSGSGSNSSSSSSSEAKPSPTHQSDVSDNDNNPLSTPPTLEVVKVKPIPVMPVDMTFFQTSATQLKPDDRSFASEPSTLDNEDELTTPIPAMLQKMTPQAEDTKPDEPEQEPTRHHEQSSSDSSSSNSDSSSEHEVQEKQDLYSQMLAKLTHFLDKFKIIDDPVVCLMAKNDALLKAEAISDVTHARNIQTLNKVYNLAMMNDFERSDFVSTEIAKLSDALDVIERSETHYNRKWLDYISHRESFKNLLHHTQSLSNSSDIKKQQKGNLIKNFLLIIYSRIETRKEIRLWNEKTKEFSKRFNIILQPGTKLFDASSPEETTTYKLFMKLKADVVHFETVEPELCIQSSQRRSLN